MRLPPGVNERTPSEDASGPDSALGAAVRAGGGLIDVLINPAAGRGRAAGRVLQSLAAGGLPCRARPIPAERLETEVRRRVDAGEPLVVVSGGDGSMLTAALALVGTDSALGVLPLGTLNHFARRIGIPDVEAAGRALRGGRTVQIDVGILDDRIFLNTATFGMYADVVRLRDRLGRGRFTRWPAATVALATTVVRHRLMEVSVEAEDQRVEGRTAVVWVGVGRGSFAGEVEKPRRGGAAAELEVALPRAETWPGTLRLVGSGLLALARGRSPARLPGLRMLHTRRFVLGSRHRIGITLDGETARGEGPLFVGVQPRALRVLVPPDRDPD